MFNTYRLGNSNVQSYEALSQIYSYFIFAINSNKTPWTTVANQHETQSNDSQSQNSGKIGYMTSLAFTFLAFSTTAVSDSLQSSMSFFFDMLK